MIGYCLKSGLMIYSYGLIANQPLQEMIPQKISKHSFQKIRQEMYVYFIMPYQVKKVIRITATIERKQEFELCIN